MIYTDKQYQVTANTVNKFQQEIRKTIQVNIFATVARKVAKKQKLNALIILNDCGSSDMKFVPFVKDYFVY